MKGLWPWLLMALALLCAGASASEPVFLFSYQQKPPYVVDEARGEGLYFDLARLLSQRLPEHEFVVRQIPRKRLDYLLAKDELPGLVLGVSPQWFADAQRHRWSLPFIEDANLLLSRRSGPVSRLSVATLDGHRLGLISGHHYPTLQATLHRGRVQREDAASEGANLERLVRGWLDATVVGERTLEFYLAREPAWRDQLFVAEPVLLRYQRQLLVPQRHAALLPALDAVLAGLPEDAEWQALLARYR